MARSTRPRVAVVVVAGRQEEFFYVGVVVGIIAVTALVLHSSFGEKGQWDW